MAIGYNYIDNPDYTWEEENGDGGEIDYLADLVVEGNVGIGTVNPEALLNLSGVTKFLFIDNTSPSGSLYGIKLRSNGTDVAAFTPNSSNGEVRIGGIYPSFFPTFYAGNTEAMRITTTGNVGIGTTNPGGYKLYVNATGQNAAVSVSDTGYGIYGASTSGMGVFGSSSSGYAGYFIGSGFLSTAAWTYGSDIRMKENISYLDSTSGLDKVMQLKPARFDYIKGEKNQLGFIAQDVQGVIPEAVIITDKKTGMLGLKRDFIIPYLVNAIKEQQGQIDALKQKVTILETKINPEEKT
ncbi:MAG: tail fiber domain-containing protein [Candidatus Omnitrophota bacterium]|jgi:hypothetical protein